MQNKLLWALWAVFYIICAGLGLIPHAAGFGKAMLILAAVIFFLPPGLLLHNAKKEGRRETATTVMVLSAVSLGLTLVLLLLNFISVGAGDAVGTMLHILLMILSAPMGCGQYWVIGLFGWACLLFESLSIRRKLK